MKAFVLFVCSLFALTVDCKGEENKANYRELRDSLSMLVFAVCDSGLNKKFGENLALTKMKGIYLRDGKEGARAFLAEQVKAHPENTQLRSMLDDWADIANGFEQERTMHSKSPSTSP